LNATVKLLASKMALPLLVALLAAVALTVSSAPAQEPTVLEVPETLPNPSVEEVANQRLLKPLSKVPRGYMLDVSLIPVTQPRHVHLAYGRETSEVVVTWSTVNSTGNATSKVEYGLTPRQLDLTSEGASREFLNTPVNATHVQYIHRVHLTGLKPNTTYFYSCGGNEGWSPVFSFKTVPAAATSLRVAIYGDLGVINARSLARLQHESHQGVYDAIVHVGDFAYNMDTDEGVMGDTFMDQIEPIAGYLPYMTCPGNHESADDFHQYRGRFSMPNYQQTESLYHSFDVGPVHFVAVSTEVYYYGPNTEARVQAQYEWLVQDLEWAAAPENRTRRPWVVIYGHRPMYCSMNDDWDDCHFMGCKTRVGLNGKYGMEELLVKYGVDLAVWAHEHTWERLYPTYNYTVYKNGTDPYYNPKGPTHITTGSAGCQENLDRWSLIPGEFTACRLNVYGYTHLNVHNATHMTLQEVEDTNGTIADSVTIVREVHDNYPHIYLPTR